MTVETEVANLTTAVDGLTSAVNVSKATLDASVADSESARDQSQTARDTASAHKLAAEAAATSATSTASALTGFDLSAINDTISDTAVDVFVYDTSKDSDGGAWRKRTQGTSWYNETLNTATRGARREFPAVAVIVAESQTVTIYDGDDPALPMWMVFDKTNGGTGYLSNPDSSAVISATEALNGTLTVGHSFAYAFAGLVVISFLSDSATKYNQSSQLGVLNLTIAERNNTGASPSVIKAVSPLVNYTILDVAMTVLPDAPIDAATGLQVPTIAVGTGGGVSVITDSGAVYDSAYTDGIAVVAFDEDNGVWYNRNTSYHALSYASLQDWTSGDGFGDVVASTNINVSSFNLLTRGTSSGFGVYGSTLFSGAISATGPHLKKLHLHDINYEDQSKGLDAAISTEYNTGWMNGDIKLATLSDTDDTDVVGSELATNGDGSTTTGWTATNATLSSEGGYLKVTSTGGARPKATQNITTVVGQAYVLTATARRGTCVGPVEIEISGNNSASTGSTSNTTDTFVYSTFIATSTTHILQAKIDHSNSASGETAFFDNISVRLAEADRSVNGNGLQVFGTVTKNPVATGADLVGYSGFYGTRYLEQPYNSDLDFGTGDFCIMGWVKESAAVDYLIDRVEGRDGSSNLWGFTIWQMGQNLRFDTYQNNASTNVVSATAMGDNDGVWYFFTAVRRNGVVEMYMQGKLDATTSGTARDVSYTSTGNPPPLTIGAKGTHSNAWTNGSAALIRISATAPSAEQIAKIYNDEKVLFQENAQATLYGSSDAVTALAYDDTTGLLHAGTSAGRSVFQGLRRVENTTDAVGTAISASNGLVAEE